MSWLSRIFGGGSEAKASAAAPVEYKDCRIYAEPVAEGGQYRLAARIEKDVDGETKVHQLIRADTLADRDAVVEISVAKAKQMIDEQGDRIFG